MPKTHILVIEDDEDARTMYGIMLRSWGYDVTEADNGRDGVRIAQRQPPDLILLDVMMPDLDGYEVCKLLRGDSRLRAIPIIFLTALDATNERIKAYTMGGDDFITKGQVDYRELGVRIQAALERARRLQAPATGTAPGITVGLMSLRGGVGVSTLAVHLARQSAMQSDAAPTLLVDLAFPVGSIGLWSGVTSPRDTVALLSRRPATIDLPMIESYSLQNVGGFSLIPAPSTLVDTQEMRPESAERVINVLREAGYFTILDLGRGELPLRWGVPQLCDWLVVITTDEITARSLAGVALSSLPQVGVNPRGLLLVFNDVTGARPADMGAGLPRVPDVYVPFVRDFQETADTSALSRLWSMVSTKAPHAGS